MDHSEASTTSVSDPYEERDDAQHSARSNEMHHATVEAAPPHPAAPEAEQQTEGVFVYIERYAYTAKAAGSVGWCEQHKIKNFAKTGFLSSYASAGKN